MSDDVIRDLDSMIDALKRVDDATLARVYGEFERIIDADIRSTIAAGTTPDGTPWPPRKSDGGRALVHVADNLAVEAVRDGVLVRLYGKDVLHHRGHSRGHVERQVIYVGDMPARVVAKLDEAATRIVNEALRP